MYLSSSSLPDTTDACSGSSTNSDTDIADSPSSLFHNRSAFESEGNDHDCTAPVSVETTRWGFGVRVNATYYTGKLIKVQKPAERTHMGNGSMRKGIEGEVRLLHLRLSS